MCVSEEIGKKRSAGEEGNHHGLDIGVIWMFISTRCDPDLGGR